MNEIRVVTGIRATGRMHIGNYLGVLERLGAMSRDESMQCFFFVADLHTLTTASDMAKIREHAPEIVRDIIAAGVDVERSIIYTQSDVPRVAELAWLLACHTPDGDLGRLPHFKDKSGKQPGNVNAGLRFYPVLMAADILGPQANLVPVGADQKAHLELTRDLAQRFNREHKIDLFAVPEAREQEMITVPGLVAQNERGGFDKMGKSENEGETLYLSDSPDEMKAKIRVAPTDPARVRRNDPGTPDKCAIYALHKVVSPGEEIRSVREGCQTAGIGCSDCKLRLVAHIDGKLASFRARRAELASDANLVRDVTQAGAEKARVVFDETIGRTREILGIGPLK